MARQLKLEDGWLPEKLYLIISVLTLAVLACIITVFNGQPMPQMKFGITLNTLISILSTICPATLAVSVSEALGQLKWNRYTPSTGRSLRDFETYDSASRGALGSFYLLFKLGRRDGLAVFGAIVTLVALAFGPFAQQVVTYPQRPMPVSGQNASIARAQSYVGHLGTGESYDYLDIAMVQAIYNGLLAGAGSMTVMPEFGCSTGNCTFPAFNSLAICSVCADVTAQTTNVTWNDTAVEGMTFPHVNFTFPSGAIGDVSNEYQYPTINFTDPTTSDYSSWNTTYGPALGDLYNIILAFSAIRIVSPTHSNTDPFEAVECALNLCIQTYENVNISVGRLNHGDVVSWYDTSGVPFIWNGIDSYSLTPDNSTAQYSPIGNNTYSIDVNTVKLFARYIESFMSLDCQPTVSPGLGQGGGQNGCIPGLLFQIIASTPDLHWPSLMQSLATSMTNAIRNKGGDGGPRSATGTVYTQRIFVHVEWAWFSLPVTVVVCAVVFVLIVTWTEGKEELKPPVWKTAALPIMLHGVQVCRNGSAEKSSEIQHLAKTLKVRLARGSDGCTRLVVVADTAKDKSRNG